MLVVVVGLMVIKEVNIDKPILDGSGVGKQHFTL
jgi:hypothetical protein